MRKIENNKLVWEDEDVRYLCLHYHNTPLDELGRHFGVSSTTVGKKARELELSKDSRCHVWTEEELKFLMDNFAMTAACDIADHLKMNTSAVLKKAHSLGLEKSKEWSSWKYYGRYVNNYKNNGQKYAYAG